MRKSEVPYNTPPHIQVAHMDNAVVLVVTVQGLTYDLAFNNKADAIEKLIQFINNPVEAIADVRMLYGSSQQWAVGDTRELDGGEHGHIFVGGNAAAMPMSPDTDAQSLRDPHRQHRR